MSAPDSVTAPEELIVLATGIAIVAVPAMPTGPRLSVPLETPLVNVAVVPLTPAIESVPAPSELAVRLPPGPIETVPLFTMLLFVTAASTLSVPAAPTVTPPVESPLELVTRTVPAETLRLLNELAPPNTIVPGPLVVSPKAPDTGPFKTSEYDVLLLVQVCALARATAAEPTLPTLLPVPPVPPPNLPNPMSPVMEALSRMPVPADTPLVPVALSVTVVELMLPAGFWK